MVGCDITHIAPIFNTQLLEFDQAEFLLDVPEVISMDRTGYIYVPSSCKSRSSGSLQQQFVLHLLTISLCHHTFWASACLMV